MTVGTNYSSPVVVNGFLCKNCTDVDYAKKHIDPAHPKSGPYGIDAKADPTVKKTPTSEAVTFGGALSGPNAKQASTDTQGTPDTSSKEPPANPAADGAVGTQLDLSA